MVSSRQSRVKDVWSPIALESVWMPGWHIPWLPAETQGGSAPRPGATMFWICAEYAPPAEVILGAESGGKPVAILTQPFLSSPSPLKITRRGYALRNCLSKSMLDQSYELAYALRTVA